MHTDKYECTTTEVVVPKDRPPLEFFTEKGRLIPGVLGDLIRQELRVAVGRGGRLYIYEDGAWRLDDSERTIRAKVREMVGTERVRANHYSEVLADMRAAADKLPEEKGR